MKSPSTTIHSTNSVCIGMAFPPIPIHLNTDYILRNSRKLKAETAHCRTRRKTRNSRGFYDAMARVG